MRRTTNVMIALPFTPLYHIPTIKWNVAYFVFAIEGLDWKLLAHAFIIKTFVQDWQAEPPN